MTARKILGRANRLAVALGRSPSRTARIPRTWGPEIIPLEPKPPPRNGLRIRMFSGGIPKSPAIRACAQGVLARR